MQVEAVPPESMSADDRALWNAWRAATPGLGSPFLGPGWPVAVARAYGRSDHPVRVAVLRDGGVARAFLPARVGALAALPVGAPLCDYQAVVAAPGRQVDARSLVRALGCGRFDFDGAVEGGGLDAWTRAHGATRAADLSEGYAAYAARRRATGSDAIKDVEKKRRKLERDVGALTFTAASPSRADYDRLIRWKRAQMRSTGQTDVLDSAWSRRLLESLWSSRDPAFGATLFTLHVEDRLAAAHLALAGGRELHAWFIAHDEMFARYSPGLLLLVDILRWMDGRYDRLDFGPGDYRFKTAFGDVERRVGRGFVGVPSAAALMRDAQWRVRAAAEALPLGRASALPGKAMRRLDIWRAVR